MVWTSSGHFDATHEGAAQVYLRFAGLTDLYSFDQFASLMHTPGLVELVLEGMYKDSPIEHRIPPTIFGDIRADVVAYGLNNIAKGVATKPADRIQVVRCILPIVKFNKTPRVELGLKRLRRYRRKFNDALQAYTAPEHDENSHGADAFGEYAHRIQRRPVAASAYRDSYRRDDVGLASQPLQAEIGPAPTKRRLKVLGIGAAIQPATWRPRPNTAI